MIEVRDASFGYRDRTGTKTVASHVSFSLREGQLVCMLGANGAGKTTIFRTILSSLPLLSGEIRIDGEPAASLSRPALARKISYVPQQHTPPFPYSVLQIVEMGRCVHIGDFSSPTKRDEETALEKLEQLGIGSLSDRIYTELSGGERQLVLIARALAQESRYILLDEPTASLDFGNENRLLEVVKELAENGKGILMILHDPEAALKLDGDAVILTGQNGSVCGKTADLLTEKMICELYGIQAEIHTWMSKEGTSVRSIHTEKTIRK